MEIALVLRHEEGSRPFAQVAAWSEAALGWSMIACRSIVVLERDCLQRNRVAGA